MAGGMCGGDMFGRGHAWQGTCVAGGVHEGACVVGVCMAGGHAWSGDMHGRGEAWQCSLKEMSQSHAVKALKQALTLLTNQIVGISVATRCQYL